ncbi:MAG: hypothetical protein C0172_04060 [Caldisphaera sp.]|nr:MAG: hypothetical protein C0201_02800 [Caldisphaera sp.]PMP87788.1 MAG: hypothetical protein C0172_04060 [Caldisphaera sp.]
MARKKTSIFINEDLWKKIKEIASKKDIEISLLLEDMIKEELGENIEAALREIAGSFNDELDFEPIKPKEGFVSNLVREMRDERANSLS